MGPRIRRFLRASALYTVIVAATLFVADLLMILFGLFPPPHNAGDPIAAWVAARPTGYPGDPVAGWVAARPTGQMRHMTCREFALERSYDYQRNEDGVRTSFSTQELRDDDNLFKVAVTGDSQTELCAPNELSHFGVLDRELRSAGLPAAAFSYAAGKYSPLQAYLAVKRPMQDYDADVLVLNVYTGNDIYDMLRVDDRPHFVRAGNGYEIAPPVWYQDDPPDLRRRSRVLYALSAIGTRTGLRETFVRLRYLYAIAAEQGLKLPSVAAYVNDLRKSAASDVGYPDAFIAQMLNQQLFFHHFPGTGEESMRRLHALLDLVPRENPNRMLVLSALPSYQLISKPPVDPALLAVLERLPLTYEGGVREENQFYAKLRDVAEQSGWVFVDNLRVLREYTGADPLYNDYDYHFLPVASEIIGKAQAQVSQRMPCPPIEGAARRHARSEERGVGKECRL